jgi:hypothetical protein
MASGDQLHGLQTEGFAHGLPTISVAAWVTAGGASVFYDLGGITGLEISDKKTLKKIYVDNVFYALDVFYTARDLSIKGICHQADLLKYCLVAGDPMPASFNPLTTNTLNIYDDAASAAITSRTLCIGQETAIQYYTVKIVLTGLNVKVRDSQATAFTKRTVSIWRCVFQADIKQMYVKDNWLQLPFTGEAIYDTTAISTNTHQGIGKIVDSTT